MTELEQLEQNTKIEYAKQRSEELTSYMDSLMDSIEKMNIKARNCFWFEVGIVIFWVIFLFINIHIADIAWTVWVLVIMINFARVRMPLSKLFGEFDGCIITLEILGLIQKIDKGNKRPKKEKESFMAMQWAEEKKQKMEEAIA